MSVPSLSLIVRTGVGQVFTDTMFYDADPILELGERCEQGKNKSLDETARTQHKLLEKSFCIVLLFIRNE